MKENLTLLMVLSVTTVVYDTLDMKIKGLSVSKLNLSPFSHRKVNNYLNIPLGFHFRTIAKTIQKVFIHINVHTVVSLNILICTPGYTRTLPSKISKKFINESDQHI